MTMNNLTLHSSLSAGILAIFGVKIQATGMIQNPYTASCQLQLTVVKYLWI